MDAPRLISAEEHALLAWLLPAERPGYARMLQIVESLVVIGAGRWGEGDLILGHPGDAIDVSGPMARVFATGTIVRSGSTLTATIHEEADGQVEVQFILTAQTQPFGDADRVADPARALPHDAPLVPEGASELRRYTYSQWWPGDPAPASGTPVREVHIAGASARDRIVLAVSQGDERIWVHEAATGINHLIPHTNFYNELMRHLSIRTPEFVFAHRRLFTHCGDFRDEDLVQAFLQYNKSWKKLAFTPEALPPASKRSSWIRRIFPS